jgi:diguanylate cyclase (GGDEF)-like protein/PAS domain S-box-containing protein
MANPFSVDGFGDGDPIAVLLVESDAARAEVIGDALAEAGNGRFRIETVTRLPDALERLVLGGIEVVLVGPGLSDCADTDVFGRIRQAAPGVLVLPLEGADFESGQVDRCREAAHWLPYALQYVGRHKKAESVLRTAEETLFEEKEWARVTLSSIGDAVLVTDVHGNVTYLNPAAEALTGWPSEEAAGRPLAEVFHIVDGGTRQPAVDPARRAIAEDRTVGLEANCVLMRPDGSESDIEDSAAPVHDRHGRVAGAVIVFRDVSQSRAMTRKMAYLAQHDALTGLSNRTLLRERLDQAIHLARRHDKQVALLFVDLNDFKLINDKLGHVVGDHVLQTVADFLVSCVRTADTVCRLGGDEFVILLSEIERPEDAFQVAEKLLTELPRPLVVDGHALRVSMSTGISVFPEDGEDMEALLRHADSVMYHAKSQGDDDAVHLPATQGIKTSAADERAWSSLSRAVREGEFTLHYQPQMDLASGGIVGVEALLRWQQPGQGLTYPRHFMLLAQQSGLIIPIGRWVLREACRQVAAWQSAGLPALPVAVNVSGPECRNRHFVRAVSELLAETALDPNLLELEMNERVLMSDVGRSLRTLKALKDVGVRIAINDFGRGHSSLRYLKRLPIDTIKVDEGFMPDIRADRESTVILRTIIALGRSLEHRVVAQGVETAQQLEFLRSQNCHVAQGFQISHPLPREDAGMLLAIRRDARPQQSC